MSNKEEIEQLVRRQERAIQQKDIDGAMARYSENIVSFDVVDTLEKVGLVACRERLENWLSQFPAEFSYNVEQCAVTASEDLAFCHCFNHVKGALASGDEIDMRWRSTTCFQRVHDQWIITHEHSSVPFDPETGKALINLEE